MKKNQLSLAVAATAAGLASAAYADMYVNADGSGEALIFRSTLLNLIIRRMSMSSTPHHITRL